MSSCDTCSCADKTNCPKKGSSYGFDVVTENSYYETAEIMEGGETGGKCNCGAFSDNSDALMTSDADYLPISAEGDVEDDDDLPNYSHANGGVTTTNTSAAVTHDSANPLFSDLNGSVSALDLNGDGRYDEGFEEEERAREREEDLMQRAFVEDERRRNAPLTTENAVRVMDAMRGISFLGFPPDWAGRVSEDRWIGHLSRLRTTEDQSSATDTSPPNATPE